MFKLKGQPKVEEIVATWKVMVVEKRQEPSQWVLSCFQEDQIDFEDFLHQDDEESREHEVETIIQEASHEIDSIRRQLAILESEEERQQKKAKRIQK